MLASDGGRFEEGQPARACASQRFRASVLGGRPHPPPAAPIPRHSHPTSLETLENLSPPAPLFSHTTFKLKRRHGACTDRHERCSLSLAPFLALFPSAFPCLSPPPPFPYRPLSLPSAPHLSSFAPSPTPPTSLPSILYTKPPLLNVNPLILNHEPQTPKPIP